MNVVKTKVEAIWNGSKTILKATGQRVIAENKGNKKGKSARQPK